MKKNVNNIVSGEAALNMTDFDKQHPVRGFFHPGDLLKHKKTGNIYVILDIPARVRIEATNTPAYMYRLEDASEDDRVWVRPKDEMEDGRFDLVGRR